MKMKRLLLCGWLLAATAGSASAAGLNLGWNDCAGLGAGELNRTFACNSNAGAAHILMASFVAPAGLVRVTGFETTIEVQTELPTLSPWWDIGGCRSALAVTFSTDFTGGPFSCLDYWAGGATGGGAVILPPASGGDNRIRIRSGFALPAGSDGIGPIAEGAEAYAVRTTINNSRTVGLGACGGCADEVCMAFTRILVTNEPGTPEGDFEILNVATRAHVTFQGWTNPDPTQACPDVTPVVNRTWGSVKALYR